MADPQRPTYERALVWTLLVAVWARVRLADFEGVDMNRFKLTGTELIGVLVRTKTTGPGKRVHEVKFHVRRGTSLAGVGWLTIGWEIWEQYRVDFPRNFLSMKSNTDRSFPVLRYLEPDGMANYFRCLIMSLPMSRRQRFTPQFRLADDQYLMCEDSAMFFTGHSMRHTLPTISAAMGLDYLGRGHIPMRSQQYVHTSRQVVHRAQEAVAKGLCTGDSSYGWTTFLISAVETDWV